MSTKHFEDQLLAELKQVVAARAETAPQGPERQVKRVRRRPRLALVGTAAAFGVAGVVAVPLIAGEDGNAAYAVSTNDDGTVTVTIHHYSDEAGLEAKLAEHGIRSTVEWLPLGKMCKEPWFTGDSDAGSRLAQPKNDGAITFTLDPNDFTGAKSLVVQSSGPENGPVAGTEIMVAIATGQVGDCEPVDSDSTDAGHHGDDGVPSDVH